MENEYRTREIALTASVISHNLFDQLRDYYGLGSMDAHDAIAQMAVRFENAYAHVKEWDEYLSETPIVQVADGNIIPVKATDWEEFVLLFVEAVKHEYNTWKL